MSDENKEARVLSYEKIEALKKKFEEHLKDDSEEIRNELARQVDLIGENIEQIAEFQTKLTMFEDRIIPEIKEENNLDIYTLLQAINGWAKNHINLEEVLRDSIYTSRNAFLQIKSVLQESDLLKASTVAESYKEQLEKLDSKQAENSVMRHLITYTNEVTKELLKEVEKKEDYSFGNDEEREFHKRAREYAEIAKAEENDKKDSKKDSGGVDVVESFKHTCSFCGRKLILYGQEWICGHGCTKPAIRPDEKLPEFVCSLELQGECGNEGSMDCLKGNSKGERFDNNVCVHGKKELEKPKAMPELVNTSEPLYPKVVYQLGSDSREYIELKEKYDKLIGEFLDDLEPYGDKVKSLRVKWRGRFLKK